MESSSPERMRSLRKGLGLLCTMDGDSDSIGFGTCNRPLHDRCRMREYDVGPLRSPLSTTSAWILTSLVLPARNYVIGVLVTTPPPSCPHRVQNAVKYLHYLHYTSPTSLRSSVPSRSTLVIHLFLPRHIFSNIHSTIGSPTKPDALLLLQTPPPVPLRSSLSVTWTSCHLTSFPNLHHPSAPKSFASHRTKAPTASSDSIRDFIALILAH